ncbi:hypothetical protein H4582DRAFT_2080590 [Lactarius indigo]|nr:hypothetical protein H4582DRAFT_2080590 [Lactarius indigo]
MPLENAQIVAPVAGLRRGCPAPNGTISSTHTGRTPFHTTGSSFSDLGDPYESAPSSPLARPRSSSPICSASNSHGLVSVQCSRGHINSIGTLCKSEASPLTQKQSIALPLPHAHNSRWTFPRCSILQLVPHPKPVFYSNRATCYVSMEPSQHEEVVADCDEVLKLDTRYIKALNRRATVLEALEHYEVSLRDCTATTILSKF